MTYYLFYNLLGQAMFEPADGIYLVAIPKNGVTIVEVPERYYSAMINKKCGCCDSTILCFRNATEEEIKRWKGV